MSNVDYFKELPFYNVSIDKPIIKRLKNVDLLAELPFYKQLSIIKTGSSYIDLPIELKHPRKGLKNIKNNDQKCFLWGHVRHINPVKYHPGRIRNIDRDFANNLNYDGTEFPVQEKHF